VNVRKACSLLVLSAALSGCMTSWVQSPSPTVKALVRDLTLQGYQCEAGFSEIECKHEAVQAVKQTSICDATRCYPRGETYQVSVYRIQQKPNGLPLVRHTVERADPPPAKQSEEAAPTSE
jgi:hypothetical protein